MSNPLKNPDAEACAQRMAGEFPSNRRAAITHFDAFRAGRPDLKFWELLAIGERAIQIFLEKNPDWTLQKLRRALHSSHERNQST